MTALRRNLFRILMLLALFALPGSDIECEDGEFEMNLPDVYHDTYWGPPVYYEPAPCCWFW